MSGGTINLTHLHQMGFNHLLFEYLGNRRRIQIWFAKNGYRIYVDILTGENLASIQLANMDLIYWTVRLFSWDGIGVKGVEGGIVILASWELHFIRVHENLVQHPCNNISILQNCLFILLYTCVLQSKFLPPTQQKTAFI